MLTEDRNLWACAFAVEKQHGAGTPRFVAARIGALALAGDKAIARKLDALART